MKNKEKYIMTDNFYEIVKKSGMMLWNTSLGTFTIEKSKFSKKQLEDLWNLVYDYFTSQNIEIENRK